MHTWHLFTLMPEIFPGPVLVLSACSCLSSFLFFCGFCFVRDFFLSLLSSFYLFFFFLFPSSYISFSLLSFCLAFKYFTVFTFVCQGLLLIMSRLVPVALLLTQVRVAPLSSLLVYCYPLHLQLLLPCCNVRCVIEFCKTMFFPASDLFFFQIEKYFTQQTSRVLTLLLQNTRQLTERNSQLTTQADTSDESDKRAAASCVAGACHRCQRQSPSVIRRDPGVPSRDQVNWDFVKVSEVMSLPFEEKIIRYWEI